jgi:hypothetical protein
VVPALGVGTIAGAKWLLSLGIPLKRSSGTAENWPWAPSPSLHWDNCSLSDELQLVASNDKLKFVGHSASRKRPRGMPRPKSSQSSRGFNFQRAIGA